MSLYLSHNLCMCHRPNQFLTRTFDAINEKILECEAASAAQAKLLGEGGGGGNVKAADDASAPTAAAAASPVATSAAVKTAGTVGGAAAAAEGAGGVAKKGPEQHQTKAGERVMVVGGALTLQLGEAMARLLATLEEGEGEGGPQRLFLIEEIAAVEPVPPVPVPPVPPVEHLRGYCDEAKQHLIDTLVSKWSGR